ncbi:hypothetical protein J2801_001870 [Paraburkholderia phenoliruptrix]|uniref:hypothetical protein n=1 Tax=Paraburkholderia phenoliruptrix TaxID=252970 RepID=UPI00285FD960|nr:hypothetical protein [Paraburkholderia phenoliruptrix]MDR6419619.1 hypothetical protein [Paraburkholderia phenoliruptrix]
MNFSQFSTAFVFAIGLVVAAHAEGLCKSEEAAIFNCELPKSISSLCRSSDASVLTYRNGIKGRLNLEISDGGGERGRVFYFSNIPYSGGGEAHIRFSRSGYTYFIYDKTIKSDDGAISSAGLVVYKGDKKISNLVCGNDASIREVAYHAITKETYRSIGAR